MTREQSIRKRLVDFVDAILARYEGQLLSGTTHGDVRIRSGGGHDVPVMSASDARSMTEVVDALLRVDAGKYGVCESCADAIGYERLLEFPTTPLCEACARDEDWRPSRSPG